MSAPAYDPQACHEALDWCMACWAMDTHRLFGQTKMSEFLEWLIPSEATERLPTEGALVRRLMQECTRRTRLLASEITIMELAVWSYGQVKRARHETARLERED